MTTTDATIAALLGTPVSKAFSADEPPPGFFDDDGPEAPAPANGARAPGPATPKKTARERQADEDRARIVWAADLDVEDEPITFLSTGFLASPGRPAVICGEGGTKKSLLLHYLLMCVGTGMQFFGHDTQRGKSLFMDFEQGLRISRMRSRRFARGYDFRLRDHHDRIAYVERPFFLDDVERSAERLADLVRGFTVVGVDSAFRCAPKLKQNDAEAAIPFEIMTRASLWTGASFVVVDHASTKRDTDARRKSMQSGNHHKLDGAGTVYALSSEKHDGRWLPTLVTCEREQLDGDKVEDFAFDAEDVLDPSCADKKPPYTKLERKWGLRLKLFGPEAAKAPQKPKADASEREPEPALYQIGLRIVEEVKKQPGVSSGELLERLKIHKGRLGQAIAILVRDSKIQNRTGKATRTEWVAT